MTRIKIIVFILLFHSGAIAQNPQDRIMEYKAHEDSLYSLLILDFASDYSLFTDYSSPGIKQCEGSFDLTTYDSLKRYTDTVFFYQSPVDGTVSPVVQEFHVMKKGGWKYYYSNGKLHYLGNYERNVRSGEWKFYSDDGELQLIRHYREGKIIREKLVGNGRGVYPER